jgi:hypothetical protein
MQADVDVQIKRIETGRTAEGVTGKTEVEFNVNSSISESDRGPGFINLKYSIDLQTDPSAAHLFVSGMAKVKGRDDDMDALLAATERDGTPKVFMKVYQKIYPTMFLLCGALDIPYPGPGLLRQNRVEAGAQRVSQSSSRSEGLGISP